MWTEELSRRLEAMNIRRMPGETPMSFTRRLDAEGKLPVSLGTLGECVSLLHYGRVHAVQTDTELARGAALGLKRKMSLRTRARYAAKRMIPGKRYDGALNR